MTNKSLVEDAFCIGNCLEFSRILYKLPFITEKHHYNLGQILDPKTHNLLLTARRELGDVMSLKNSFCSSDIQGHPTYQLRSHFEYSSGFIAISAANLFCRKL